MKTGIHPKYNTIKATCSCGNIIETRSTLAQDITLTSARPAIRSIRASRRSPIPVAG